MHTRPAVISSCILALLAASTGHARLDQSPLIPSADRAAFMRTSYRKEVADPMHYDLIVNVGRMPLEAAADLVAHAYGAKFARAAKAG